MSMAIGAIVQNIVFSMLTLFGRVVATIFHALKTGPIQSGLMTQVQKESTTQGFCQYLSSEYPTKNILIYHNKSSVFSGINNVHRSIKFPQFTSSGKDVFEIKLFDSGTFELAGESGYHNWAFCGSNWVQNKTSVVFYPHQVDPYVDPPEFEWLRIPASKASPAKQGGGYFPTLQEIGERDGGKIEPRADMRTRDWEWWYDYEDNEWNFYFDAQDLESEIQTVEETVADEGSIIVDSSEVTLTDGPIGAAIFVVIAAVVCLVVVSLVFLKDFIALFSQHQTERAFTQSAVTQMGSAISDKYMVVFHDQDTTLIFSGWQHYHYELPLGYFGDTQGYEIYQFDWGTVTLAGDGGYENWAFTGNWYREPGSSYVQFFPRNIGQRSLLKRAQAKTGKPVKRRAAIAPQVPIHSDSEAEHGYYFVDCMKPDNTLSLGIAYYKEIIPGGGNLAQAPDDFAEVASNHARKQLWQGEGDTTFANGMMFHWSFTNQDCGTNDPVVPGIAESTFEQLWIYKEAGGLFNNTSTNWSCSAAYYAL